MYIWRGQCVGPFNMQLNKGGVKMLEKIKEVVEQLKQEKESSKNLKRAGYISDDECQGTLQGLNYAILKLERLVNIK